MNEHSVNEQPNIPVVEIESPELWRKIIVEGTRGIAIYLPDGELPFPIDEQAGMMLYHGEDMAGVFVIKVRIEPLPLLETYLFRQIMDAHPEADMGDYAAAVIFQPFPALDAMINEAKVQALEEMDEENS